MSHFVMSVALVYLTERVPVVGGLKPAHIREKVTISIVRSTSYARISQLSDGMMRRCTGGHRHTSGAVQNKCATFLRHVPAKPSSRYAFVRVVGSLSIFIHKIPALSYSVSLVERPFTRLTVLSGFRQLLLVRVSEPEAR